MLQTVLEPPPSSVPTRTRPHTPAPVPAHVRQEPEGKAAEAWQHLKTVPPNEKSSVPRAVKAARRKNGLVMPKDQRTKTAFQGTG